jgi:glucose-6-phosphate 1-dehydrogenase
MYVATAPSLFTTVCEQIAAVGLNGPTTRVVLEKPLGHDLHPTAPSTTGVRHVLKEEQVFRIDHYLGKPSVQNLFALRFGNALFEPLWRRETLPTSRSPSPKNWAWKARGAFYDQTGALRDMVQNHACNCCAPSAWSRPSTPAPTPFATKSSRCCNRSSPGPRDHRPACHPRAVRGRHRQGQAVPGYRRKAACPRQHHRNLCGPAHRNLQLALGGRAFLHPHRQTPGQPRCRTSWSTSALCPTRFSRPRRALPTAW